ncbi:DUF427 domain-containing protein [Pseudopontixanthobacter vadosimaris]|uniref:DUF427 domain-containing protein n=1 Tax=Pseudopontixanthobacter vadosimaris TaxID=2726450 RepID=UPI0014730A00|nr:DUF427 domain-containing protein [Pseudopontixanthobacter vadosimaris]
MAVEAIWNGTIIARAEKTLMVEGNHYFPRSSLNEASLVQSDTTTVCPWKGTAHYYTIETGGERNVDAAWYYPEPKEKAAQIKDHVAFWKGVVIREC